jgi:hypothetical protein
VGRLKFVGRARQSFQQSMANLKSESYHSLIGFLTAEYLGFLMLQVVPRFTGTGTCISPVPVNRNRGILTYLLCFALANLIVLSPRIDVVI